ncbi:MAG: YceI family protein [Pseudomonadota bacterium]
MSSRIDGRRRRLAVPCAQVRRRRGGQVLLAVVLACGSPGAASGEPVVELDGRQLRIAFQVVTAGMWRVAGRFHDVRGEIVLDPPFATSQRVRVVARTGSVDTGLAIRDDRLRSTDLLDADAHPTMTFDSTSIEPSGSGKGRLVGNLELRGVVRPISLDYALSCPRTTSGGVEPARPARLVANGVVHRSRWGMSALIPLVSDDILLEIEAELPHHVCRPAFAAAGLR